MNSLRFWSRREFFTGLPPDGEPSLEDLKQAPLATALIQYTGGNRPMLCLLAHSSDAARSLEAPSEVPVMVSEERAEEISSLMNLPLLIVVAGDTETVEAALRSLKREKA